MLGNYRGSVLSWPVASGSSSLSPPLITGPAPGPPVCTMCNHLHKPCRPPGQRGGGPHLRAISYSIQPTPLWLVYAFSQSKTYLYLYRRQIFRFNYCNPLSCENTHTQRAIDMFVLSYYERFRGCDTSSHTAQWIVITNNISIFMPQRGFYLINLE